LPHLEINRKYTWKSFNNWLWGVGIKMSKYLTGDRCFPFANFSE
jgi:hypothetical protein